MNCTGHQIADTSLLAYRHLRDTGALSDQQKAVLHFLAEHDQANFTRSEISDAIGMRLSSVCGRVNELLDVTKNHGRTWITELPRRRCSSTGNMAHPVQIHRPPGQLPLFS